VAAKRLPRNTFAGPRAIVCEGRADEAFFRALITARQLPEFEIKNTGDADPNQRGGIDKFGLLLQGIPSWRGFDQLTDILLVADNDEKPADNFRRVRDQIAAVTPFGLPAVRYTVPNSPLERTTGTPTICILMIPWADAAGNLESLCLQSAMDAAPAMALCVDAFATCTTAGTWPEVSRLSQMKLRSILAARHKSNPFIGIGRVWNEDASLIPLQHASFDQITGLLESYRA
jgi:hypothetical protein